MSDWNDIGEKLRKKREASDLDLADISHQLRIPVPTLRALEVNDYSQFASPAYAKSFLQQYSEHLDIDAHDWLQSFDTSTVLSDIDSYDYLHPDPENQTRSRTVSIHKNRHKDTRTPNHLPLILFLLSVTLIGALFYSYTYVDKLINKTLPAEKAKVVVDKKNSTPKPKITSPAPNESTDAEKTPDPIAPVIIPKYNPIPRAIVVPEDGEEIDGITEISTSDPD